MKAYPTEDAVADAALSPFAGAMHERFAGEAITFDDVLLVPARSGVAPPEADLRTRLTRNITLNIPLVSAPMDTVTESRLAIALAQEGGMGIIHKNLTPEQQAMEVQKVKRSENGVITDPITLGPDSTIGEARRAMFEFGVSGFPVTEDGAVGLRTKGKVVGIFTARDLKFAESDDLRVKDVMTSEPLITAAPDTTMKQAAHILNEAKVEKLILVDEDGCLAGLITRRDVDQLDRYPMANRDGTGRLRCGAAVGVFQYDRVEALMAADVDVIVVDTAHGHSENVIETVKQVKSRYGVELIAGNVGTGEGARDLIEAGADAVKVGIGPGSICTTRVVTGVGVPQISAVMAAAEAAREAGVPIIADGGIRMSGDIAKALAAGASCVMLGGLFAGLDESPGELVISEGRRFKTYRGMGSEGAMNAGSADRYGQADKYEQRQAARNPNDIAAIKFVPEGVEGLVAYRGGLTEFVYQMVGGIRSTMGYCGCPTIEDLRTKSRFCKISAAGMVESHPHDMRITKEAPNYQTDPKRR